VKIAVDKRVLTMSGIGLGLIAIAIGVIFYIQRGAHIELKGSVLKVRTQSLDENSSVAVVDFRFVNPSDYTFVVRGVTVTVKDGEGNSAEGAEVSEVDAKRLFEYYPTLGQKFNDSLLMRDKIAPHESQDRMIAARFDIPAQRLNARKELRIRVEEVDGPVSELVEKK
jgi:hypothetical protein